MLEERFDLERAEQLLPRLEQLLRTAVEDRKVIVAVEQEYARLVKSIFLQGGLWIDVARFSRRRQEKEECEERLQATVRAIETCGCLLKDLDLGLIDFPCRAGDREVYLCWKLGEPSIRFWHGLEEGFSGRKPIDQRFLAQFKRPRPV